MLIAIVISVAHTHVCAIFSEPSLPPRCICSVKNAAFVGIIDHVNKWWDWVKLLAFDQTDFGKVVFLDGDTMFLRNADLLFGEPGGTHTDGPKAPFNSGMFVLEPDHGTYVALRDMVLRGDYDVKKGWGSAWVDKDRRYHSKGGYAPFFGAESTQGLFYHWFHDVKQQFKLLDREVYHYQGTGDPNSEVYMQHFNICPKPKPGVVSSAKCAASHKKWNEIYSSLGLSDSCVF
jgi:hypothetical protein